MIAAGCGGDNTGQTSSHGRTSIGQALDDNAVIQAVERHDIVSNQSGASVQDPDLQNAWGLAFNPRGIAWVSANGTGISEVFKADGSKAIPSVTIPTPAGGTPPSAPTGQVFNSDTSKFKGDVFIFVTEDGTISGWQGGTSAVLRADNSAAEAVYKGVTIVNGNDGRPRLYAANFHEGAVEVYDDGYNRIDASRKFRDDDLPNGFAPFNVQEILGHVAVTYAKQDDDKHDDVKGAGNGFVDLYDTDGTLMSRLISNGELNSPWGLAVAPDGFGSLAGSLLVGNFGDGRINAYSFSASPRQGVHATHQGVLGDANGNAIVIDGLWALRFGVDAGGFESTGLYFTAGPNDEADGIFGELVAVAAQGQPTPPSSARTW
jgi:uncharacterized protein (TIGR03118 family)